MGKDEAFAGQFIAGRIRTVKSGVDAATAVRYVRALRDIGIDCKFEPDTLDFDVNIGVAAPSVPATAPESASLPAAIPVRKGDMRTPPANNKKHLSIMKVLVLVVAGLFLLRLVVGIFVPASDRSSANRSEPKESVAQAPARARRGISTCNRRHPVG
jgi:hypothetical protein